MCPGRVGRATYTNNDGVRALITFSPNLGLKVFMDAHDTVTVEEGDRYPLRPPEILARRKLPRLGDTGVR